MTYSLPERAAIFFALLARRVVRVLHRVDDTLYMWAIRRRLARVAVGETKGDT